MTDYYCCIIICGIFWRISLYENRMKSSCCLEYKAVDVNLTEIFGRNYTYEIIGHIFQLQIFWRALYPKLLSWLLSILFVAVVRCWCWYWLGFTFLSSLLFAIDNRRIKLFWIVSVNSSRKNSSVFNAI